MKRLIACIGIAALVACKSGSKSDPAPGTVAESIVSTPLPIGDTHCPAGGSFFTFNDGKTV